jgi:hypothetical protein
VSTAAEEKTPSLTLEDFAGLLRRLAQEGFECLVIGGCAVGAYGRLRGEPIVSSDLDLYAERETLQGVLAAAGRLGVQVVKRPQPRSLPVAVLRWEAKEVNILTASAGLPEPADAARVARVFQLKAHGDLEVLLVDPFDLLRNKLQLNRPKDRPHIEILRRFVEEEVVDAFQDEVVPRERLAPARRLLQVTGARTLPAALVARLLPLARVPADFRFLMNHVLEAAQAAALLEQAKAHAGLAADLETIWRHRGTLPPP